MTIRLPLGGELIASLYVLEQKGEDSIVKPGPKWVTKIDQLSSFAPKCSRRHSIGVTQELAETAPTPYLINENV